jgi:hypothetical protein
MAEQEELLLMMMLLLMMIREGHMRASWVLLPEQPTRCGWGGWVG